MDHHLGVWLYCDDPVATAGQLTGLGAAMISDESLRDRYYAHPEHYVIHRESSSGAASIVTVKRLATPLLQPYQTSVRDLSADGRTAALEPDPDRFRLELELRKSRYRLDDLQVDVDIVDGLGSFLRIARDLTGSNGADEPVARRSIHDCLDGLGFSAGDRMPWEYSDYHMVRSSSRKWCHIWDEGGFGRKVLLLDGASCTGKTTLTTRLLESLPDRIRYMPRYTTRNPRQNEVAGDEYDFISLTDYRRMHTEGQFFDFRDFEFGMSYGLSWANVMDRSAADRVALGIINLGNIRLIKQLLPDASTVLIEADVATVERRLRNRGVHDSGHIEERLENARRMAHYRKYYDHVIDNSDGYLERSVEQLQSVAEKCF